MFEHISTLKTGMARRAIALAFAATVITSLAACTNTRGTRGTSGDSGGRPGDRTVSMAMRTEDKDEIDELITGVLDYDFGEYTDEAELEINDMSKDTYLKARILVRKDKVDDLKEFLNEKLGVGEEYTNDMVPRYQDHEYAVELKQMTPIRHYVTFKMGTDVKSLPINFYLVEDNGNTYLFIL